MGLFMLFYKLLKNERKGQAAPLIILITAMILVCMMVVFNVGKVSLNRVGTQNSADAGALAAASWLASGQNYIADFSQAMFAASLGFIAEMAREGFGMYYWEPDGTAQILRLVVDFDTDQIEVVCDADEVGETACKEAVRAAQLYAFYNVGVDEYKVPIEGETYDEYLDRDGPFDEWLDEKFDSDNTSEAFPSRTENYAWEDTKYRYWDTRSKDWVTYKPDTTNEVDVEVNRSPRKFGLWSAAGAILPGFSISWLWTIFGPIPIFVPFLVVPAFIPSMSPANPVVEVITTRTEPEADLGLWRLDMPDSTSGSLAKTVGGGAIFFTGGNYDCHLIEAW